MWASKKVQGLTFKLCFSFICDDEKSSMALEPWGNVIKLVTDSVIKLARLSLASLPSLVSHLWLRRVQGITFKLYISFVSEEQNSLIASEHLANALKLITDIQGK